MEIKIQVNNDLKSSMIKFSSINKRFVNILKFLRSRDEI